ncbi:hypothetical protein KP509_29G028700 [Ceratopteris richardii]|uniref:C2 NT-type domain-containing protein n=1 Tax=Ceratopteris richardii TaxID=49495 RepID=A0A8T2R6X0_CERRI|nr:hypothetical protein KP509_29G028700 [Ceratopteris richardii]
MFKANKKKPPIVKEKVDFKLEFHATKVPQRGWDKLLVSLIPLDTNKVSAKTGKSTVKNGACLWPEPVYESPLVFQDPVGNGKDATAPYKLLVSMGLSRFGILGEATIDLAKYMQAVVPVSVSLQLQNCSAGSILHVKIQRVGLDVGRKGLEDQPKVHTAAQQTILDVNTSYLDHVDTALLATADREDCVSTSCLSSDSLEPPQTPEVSESRPYGRERRGEELASPCSSIGSCSGRQDLGNAIQDYAKFDEMDTPNHLYEHSPQENDANLCFSNPNSRKSIGNSTKEQEFGIGLMAKELRSQSFRNLEEHNAILEQQHIEDLSKNEELQRSLALLKEERDNLRLEMNNMCFLGGNLHARGTEEIKLHELQDELEYEKGLNSNLSLQLKKIQDSNSDLLLEIQDLERQLQQKENKEQKNADKDPHVTVDSLKKELEELERDSHELTEENMNLISQLKQANEKLKLKEEVIEQLQLKINNVSSLSGEMETAKLKDEVEDLRSKLRDCEESYESKLSSGRTLIDDLNSSIMMVRSKNARLERELQNSEQHVSELLEEIESVKVKMEGFERERSQFVSQKAQVNAFREKASRAEQEHRGVLKRLEDLETLNKDLKAEKNRDLSAMKKQVQDSQEQALAADIKCKEALQAVENLKKEKLNLDKEISMLLNTKKAAEANVTELQSFNVILQEKLHLEQMQNAELLQKCEEMETKNAQLFAEGRANVSQINVLEERIVVLEASIKEMETKAYNLQQENLTYVSHIKELEVQLGTYEKEKIDMQSSKSASEVKLQELLALNEELSEKLKNAQEDIEWARENTNTLVNEIRELEGEIKSDAVAQQHLKESISGLESQKLSWQSQFDELSKKNEQLEQEILVVEKSWKDVSDEKNQLLVSLDEQKKEHQNVEISLQKVIRQQQKEIQQLTASASEPAIQQALLDASTLRDEKLALEKELRNVQEILMQANKDIRDHEEKVKHAVMEASIRTDEKLELEENVLKLEQMLKQAEKDVISLKQNLDFQFQEATLKEQETTKKLSKFATEAQTVQDEKLELLQKIMALEAQCSAAEIEKRKLLMAMTKMESDLEALQKEKKESERAFFGLKEEKESLKVSLGTVFKIESELEVLKKEKEAREKSFVSLNQEKEHLELSLSIVKQDMLTLQEEMKQNADALNLWEQSKTALKKSADELIIMKEHIREFELKLLEEHLEKEKLQKKIACMEEELQQKVAILDSIQVEEKGNNLFLNSSNLSDPDSRTVAGEREFAAMPSNDETCDAAGLREKVIYLEELNLKVFELEALKQQLKEQQSQLLSVTDQLDMVKQQLLRKEQAIDATQLIKEIHNLQDENASLYQEKVDLMSAQEALQKETDSLKEEKEALELALSSFSSACGGEILSQRISALEMELTEVLEANNMYKKELQSAFAKQHNVQMAALEKLGSVDQVIQDLADLKRKNMLLEEELRDMQQRYFNMSLQFAEVEAEREELVMTIRNLRGSKNKKLMPHNSINF